MIFGHLICKLLGHRWRKLTVVERKERAAHSGEAIMPQNRICRRCSAERVVKSRKTKQETT